MGFAQRDQAVQRGAHQSATVTSIDYLLTEMCDMIREGYWTGLPYSTVRHLPNLKIAPPGVMPQRERRPRPIIDYSWYDINQTACPLAPHLAMQFGKGFQRVTQHIIYANPAHGPVLLMKIDLADGYY